MREMVATRSAWRFVLVVLTLVTLAAPAMAQTSRPARPATDPAGSEVDANPAAPGFNAADSDARAVEIADAVMKKMGGRAAWDRTRYITWVFFGSRRHLWDKFTGDIRVEGTDRRSGEATLTLMNIHTGEGRVWRGGEEVTGAETLEAGLEAGLSAWINDSYWLVMPYKLKDTGVTLKHVGEGETRAKDPAEVLELTFDDVGRTPQNKYRVYVSKASGLVVQWDYYSTAEDDEPRISTPWTDWTKHGEILLSGGRGQRRLDGIGVLDTAPAGCFTKPDPIDWESIIAARVDDDD